MPASAPNMVKTEFIVSKPPMDTQATAIAVKIMV